MNSIDISEVDKMHFKCYKFPDGSIYYGEIAYLDDYGNVVTELEKYNDDMMKKLKLVRHGLGVQLFGVTDTTSLCRYEGYWEKDKKNGQGICFYPDKSIYDGTFVDDLFDGYGKFSWSNNDIYIGEWKNGRMDGDGEFKHNDGHILKGKFRNNYYFDKERFLNPFMSQDELIRFRIKNQEFKAKLKSENEKFSLGNIIKVKNLQDLHLFVDKTIHENKTPIIIRQSNCLINKEEIYKSLNKGYREIDLRKISIEYRRRNNNLNNMDEMKNLVEVCIVEGLNLIINFDDCEVKYEELYDPDIKELYGNCLLSVHFWTPQVFQKDDCWSHHMNERNDIKLDKNFKFLTYSKFVVEENLKDDELLVKILKRFEKSFPLSHTNVLIITK